MSQAEAEQTHSIDQMFMDGADGYNVRVKTQSQLLEDDDQLSSQYWGPV